MSNLDLFEREVPAAAVPEVLRAQVLTQLQTSVAVAVAEASTAVPVDRELSFCHGAELLTFPEHRWEFVLVRPLQVHCKFS